MSVVGIGNGARRMRSVRRPDEWHDLLARSAQDRTKRALDGTSELVPREEILLTTDDDRLVPPEESRALYARAGEPKKLVVLEGFGHYEVYREPAFSQVMRETVAWYEAYL